MKKTLRISALFLALCLLCLPAALAFDVVEPDASFYAADYADVLMPETENYIINHNNSLAAQTGAQIVVVTIDFLDGTDIEEYSTKLFNQWQIGDEEKNNGLLILLAVGEQVYWATQGSGISNSLTSSLLEQYLHDYLEADFDAAQYDVGIRKLFDAFIGWYEQKYNIVVTAVESSVTAPEGMETLDSAMENTGNITSELDQLPNDREPFAKGGIIGKIAGGFLIGVLVIAVATALFVTIPRSISLRKQGYHYTVFNRAFWFKSRRPPPPRQAAPIYTRTVGATPPPPAQHGPGASRPTPPPPANTAPPRPSSGGFGSGHGISGINRPVNINAQPQRPTSRPAAPSRPARSSASSQPAASPRTTQPRPASRPAPSGLNRGGMTRGGGAGRRTPKPPQNRGGGGMTRGGGAGRPSK